MAYPYYPYQPNYFGNPYQQPIPQTTPQPIQQAPMQQMQQIRQSGFVRVQSEQEAFAYPVAPGNSVTFINEAAPYCYVKTMGFSQLDRPTFERYRLVKEDAEQSSQEAQIQAKQEQAKDLPEYALKSDLKALQSEFEAFRASMEVKADE